MRPAAAADLGYAVLTLTLHIGAEALAGAGAMCRDINGSSIETGQFYVPGPKPCTICVCVNGNPTYCKAVLCKYKDQESLPNKDCKTFRFGNNCCELICLDDTLSTTTNDIRTDFNHELRPLLLGFIIIGTFFVVSIILFLRFRLKKREQQNSHIAEDQRSLGGYLDRASLQHGLQLDDLPYNGGYPLWKPPSNYFPRGEAPPPYEEAVAAARAEQALLTSMSHHHHQQQNTAAHHQLSPLNYASSAYHLIENSSGSNSGNVQSSSSLLLAVGPPNSPGLPSGSPSLRQQNSNNASPLISISAAGSRPSSSSSPAIHGCSGSLYQAASQNDVGEYDAAGASSSSFAADNIYENLPIVKSAVASSQLSPSSVGNSASQQHQQSNSSAQCLKQQQPSPARSYRQHKTLPRPGGGGGAFTISGTHRTIPRTLTTSGSLAAHNQHHQQHHQRSIASLFDPPSLPIVRKSNNSNNDPSPAQLPVGNTFFDPKNSRSAPSEINKSSSSSKDAATSALRNYKPPLATANQVNDDGSFDSVTCTCNGVGSSMNPPPPPPPPLLHDDTDDYRSECENCKSASGSRFYLDNEDELVTSPRETMTLQRRPEDAAAGVAQYYRTSLTLPTNTRPRTRNSRGNWFSSMPESSTESSDGE